MKYQEALTLWAQRRFPERKIIHVELEVGTEWEPTICSCCEPRDTFKHEVLVRWEDDTKPTNPTEYVYIDLESFLEELFQLTEENHG